jgi:hypothetical protein
MLEMYAEIYFSHLALHVKFLLLTSDFNQNWDIFIEFSETQQYKI